MIIRKLLIGFISLLFYLPAFTQTNISGIVNDYAGVTAIDPCVNALVVDTIAPFQVGDRILIIQMKGAGIDQTNSATFGTINAYNDAGKFEIATIAGIGNDSIYLQDVMANTYDANSSVQILRIPQYTDVNITAPATAKPWNGNTGGVIIMEASGNITLQDSIDVSGQGFRGGAHYQTSYSCSWLFVQDDFFYSFSADRAARKGEGIVNFDPNLECGKGPLANGGGGSNDHNGGGGGGSNLTNGGGGGDKLSASIFFCNGENPGLGGYALNSSGNRVFMGGGGGAGHQNNNSATSGGNGGGIIILIADSVIGNNHALVSNGIDAATSGGDGAGGGGAGGSILLAANGISNLKLVAEGGKGGDTDNDNSATLCHGPGGGGGGGMIWYAAANQPNGIQNLQLNGGIQGTTLNQNADTSCLNSSNGATPGANGTEQYNLQIDESTTPFTQAFSAAGDTIICKGAAVQLSASGGTSYQWSPTSGLSCSNCPNPLASPQSSTDYAVVITTAFCTFTDTVSVQVQNINNVDLGEDTALCNGGAILLDATLSGATYEWQDGSTNPTFNVTSSGLYSVTVTANGCEDADTVQVSLSNISPPDLGNDTTICFGDTINYDAGPGFSTYSWNTGSTNQDVNIWFGIKLWVTVTDSNGCVAGSDTIIITAQVCSGTDDLMNQTGIDVYPIPTDDMLYISWETPGKEGIIQIYDLEGKELYSQSFNGQNTIEIDLSSFSSGIYLLHVDDGVQPFDKRIILID